LLGQTLAPQNDRLAVNGQLFGYGHIRLPFGGGQYDPTAQGHLLGRAVSRDPLPNLLLFIRLKYAGGSHASA
jgi:hypothetical protein